MARVPRRCPRRRHPRGLRFPDLGRDGLHRRAEPLPRPTGELTRRPARRRRRRGACGRTYRPRLAVGRRRWLPRPAARAPSGEPGGRPPGERHDLGPGRHHRRRRADAPPGVHVLDQSSDHRRRVRRGARRHPLRRRTATWRRLHRGAPRRLPWRTNSASSRPSSASPTPWSTTTTSSTSCRRWPNGASSCSTSPRPGSCSPTPTAGSATPPARASRCAWWSCFELQVEEGPCFDAFRQQRAVRSDTAEDADDRWPRFAPHARDGGFVAVSAVPLRLRAQVVGALNLFSTPRRGPRRRRSGRRPGHGRHRDHRDPAGTTHSRSERAHCATRVPRSSLESSSSRPRGSSPSTIASTSTMPSCESDASRATRTAS